MIGNFLCWKYRNVQNTYNTQKYIKFSKYSSGYLASKTIVLPYISKIIDIRKSVRFENFEFHNRNINLHSLKIPLLRACGRQTPTIPWIQRILWLGKSLISQYGGYIFGREYSAQYRNPLFRDVAIRRIRLLKRNYTRAIARPGVHNHGGSPPWFVRFRWLRSDCDVTHKISRSALGKLTQFPKQTGLYLRTAPRVCSAHIWHVRGVYTV